MALVWLLLFIYVFYRTCLKEGKEIQEKGKERAALEREKARAKAKRINNLRF